MKPLLVLIATSVIAVFAIKIFNGNYDLALSARIGMCCMLLFTAIGHFAFTSGMMMMVPLFIPFKKTLVYFTGLLEIIFAIGLLLNGYYRITGFVLIAFFLLLLPANIYAALKKVDYQKADTNGSGTGYLLFRVPLQLLFMVWVYVSAIIS